TNDILVFHRVYHNLRLLYVRLSWVEPNTNIALSKNTIVGTSNTLSIGADNKLKVEHNSSEYVGGDKEIIIKGNVESTIEGDKSSEVMGNVVERVEGEYKLIANDKLNLESSNETTIRTKGNLLLT
ncbi:bacteriophage T4 gp5 trimerisation domain-containing protein, partial [Helicobacter sp. T3_23-1059]